MRGASFAFLSIVVAVAMSVLPVGMASGASPEEGPIVRIEMKLQASNGLQAHLENSERGTVTLELRKKGRLVTYEVPGEATEAGLKVRFGRLGVVDVAFTPTKTFDSTAPGPGCTGAPRTLSEGVFAGTIDFTGEREFVRIEEPQATGSMSVISPWECPEAEAKAPFARALRLSAATLSDPRGRSEPVSLVAVGRRCSCYFAAVRHRRGGSIFFGVKEEKSGDMKITRETKVRGPASTFAVDQARGTATLRPPSPLSGHATVVARPHRRGSWRSTIRVPLLGADPLDTAGPGFTAFLSLGD